MRVNVYPVARGDLVSSWVVMDYYDINRKTNRGDLECVQILDACLNAFDWVRRLVLFYVAMGDVCFVCRVDDRSHVDRAIA